jgi:long-chain fatty acid transport protein
VFYKASDKLVLGLGMYVPNGLGTEWDIYHAPSVNEGWINQNPLSKEKEHYSDHNVINIQPTIAYKLSDKLSVGLGLFYTTGKMTLRQIGLPVVSADPFMRGFSETYLDGDGTAMGANIGVLFKASEKFSLGVSGRYSTDLALEGTSETVIATPQINLTPEQLVTIGGQPNPGIPEGDVSADLPMPLILSGGIAYHISPKLTVTADVFWTNWESWDVITIEGEDFTGADAEADLKQDWKSTLETGFGIEYLTSEKLALRGGFYTVDTPAPPETISPTIPDPSRRYVITGGFGYTMGNISFNLAGEYVLFGETDVEDYEFDNTLTPENYAGIYNFNAIVITFGTQIQL